MTLHDFFKPPAFDERRPSHQAWALHIVLWSTIVVVTVIELLHMISLPGNTLRWLGMIVFVIGLNLFLIALNHSGRTQLACIICAFAYWLFITVLIAGEGTLRAPEAPAYLLITFTAGVLLGTRGGFIVGISCALTISVFVLLERHGLTHTVVKHTTVTYWYTQVFYIFMILSLQWLAHHSIQRALSVARRELERRKQTEQTLRESEERYRIVVEHIGQVIYDYDIATGKLQWQGAISKLTGFASRDAVGFLDIQRWKELIHPGDRPKAVKALETAITTNSPYQAKYRFRQKDGSYKFMEDHGVLIPGAAGKPARLIGTMTDITARKLVEDKNAELTRSLEKRVGERTAELESANRELEAFSYSVSHDLRGPLRIIDGYSSVLLADYQSRLPAEVGTLLGQIGASARRMGGLISDLLMLAQVGRQPLFQSDIQVQSMVEGIIAELRQQDPQRQVKWEVGTLLPCRGERSLIQQVFVNLLGNALKFTRDRKPGVIEITSAAENGQVRYTVRDNGVGFEMQFAKKLFAPFERLHKAGEFEGSGVGLSIVHRIIQRHGGSIQAESAHEHGATFSFTLPAPAAKPSISLAT